jgi:hypothetical protein
MNRCASCGAETSEPMQLCLHHHADDIRWAATNRIMCNFLHRGATPPRVPVAERASDLRCLAHEVA